MLAFLSGMTTFGYLIAGLFFFRFWWRTRDRLFAFFGVSFYLLALSQGASLAMEAPQDDRTWVYLLRLAGFILLLVAIIRKNLEESKAAH